MNIDFMAYIQTWYFSKCDGVWEHSYGIDISNIDNPGWKVKIDGENSKEAIVLSYENDDNDWVDITTTESEFTGYGGPEKLNELLEAAYNWLCNN